MEVIGACIEVTEAVTLFLSLLDSPRRRLSVCWNLAAASNSPNDTPSQPTQPNHITCTVQADGLGAYFLDGVPFLQKLYSSAPNLQVFVEGHNQVRPPVCLVCRGLSEQSCYSVQGLIQHSKQLIIQQERSHHPTTSLSLTLSTAEKIEIEMTRLSDHLHLLHIINPEIRLKLVVVNAERECQVYAEYGPETFRSLLKTPFKLATSLKHYHQLDHGAKPLQRQGKLHLVKGDSMLLPCCVAVSQSAMPVNLRLCCAAALVPHYPLTAVRKFPADHLLTHLNIHLFGPAMLPVIMAGSSVTSLPSSLLADWSQYRIALGDVAMARPNAQPSPLLVPSVQYKVIDSQVVLPQQRTTSKQVLQLFLFFEHQVVTGRSGLGGNSQWAHHMDLTSALRKNLLSLMSTESEKFHKAVHSALNKLICNYAVYAELRRRIEKVVPSVAEAVSSIVKHSTSLHFKGTCRNLLQLEGEATDDDDEIKKTLTDKLLELSQRKLDVGPLCFTASRDLSSSTLSGQVATHNDTSPSLGQKRDCEGGHTPNDGSASFFNDLESFDDSSGASQDGRSQEAVMLGGPAIMPGGLSQEAILPGGPSQEAILPGGPSQEAFLPGGPSQEAILPGGLSQEAVLPGGLSQEAVLSGGPSSILSQDSICTRTTERWTGTTDSPTLSPQGSSTVPSLEVTRSEEETALELGKKCDAFQCLEHVTESFEAATAQCSMNISEEDFLWN